MYRYTARRLVVWGLIALVGLGLAVSPALVRAQQDACFGLKADDCQLLLASDKPPQGALSSFSMDYQISFKSTGLPEGDSDLTIHGAGPFSFQGDLSALTGQAMNSDGSNMPKLTDSLGKI